MSKQRRDRTFDQRGEIVSCLPAVSGEHSRVVVPKSVPNNGFLDLRGSHRILSASECVNRIVCGDASSVLSKMDRWAVSCAITSPPYWNMVDYGVDGQIGVGGSYAEYRRDLSYVWNEIERVLKPNGKFCLNVPLMPIAKQVSDKHFGKQHTRVLLDMLGDLKNDILRVTDLSLYSLYIWEKQTTEKMFGSYPYPPNLYERNYIEFIAVFVKPGKPDKLPKQVKEKAKLTTDQWMDLTKQIWWMYPENVGREKDHPAPFPEALPNRLLNMYTFPAVPEHGFVGDIVLDPFCGWGTTCVAAKRCGRPFIGIDLSPTFCNKAIERLSTVFVDPVVMTAAKPQKG